MSSQWGSQKLLQGLVSHELTAYLSVFDLFLTQWIMAILSKGCKLDKIGLYSSLKLNFTNIRGLHSDFAECKSFLESNSPYILVLCETKLDDSINSGNIPVTGYLRLIRKDFITDAWSCSLCEKRTSFCTGLISRKLCEFLCYRLALLQSVSYFFFLYRWPSLSACTVFDYISSNLDGVI